MKTTRMLLLIALSMCWSILVAEAQTGTIEGTALVDGTRPAADLRVSAYAAGYPYLTVLVDDYGHYLMTPVPTGVPVNVYVVIGFGYHVISPADGSTTVTLAPGATATVDIALETIQGGAARGLGWWRHQINGLLSGHGNTECSLDDFNHYWYVLGGGYAGGGLWGMLPECYLANRDWRDGWSGNGPWMSWREGLNGSTFAYTEERWGNHVVAVFANIASNRLHWGDVVSADGATVSQAILEMCSLSGDSRGLGPSAPDAERIKSIAETMNEGRMIPAGVIDLTRPTIYYAHAMPSAPMLDQVRVTPNPMVRSCALDFEVATPGRVEVRVFDIAGRAVRTLLDGELPGGRQTVVWDGRDDGGAAVANGVYFYRVEMPGGAPLTTRFVVMR